MGDRGRTPAAQLSVASDNTEKLAERPQPPEHLTSEQQEIWRKTVNSLAADWFRTESHEVLAQYCRHVIQARHVAKLIEDMEGSAENFNARDYALLLRTQKAESEIINSTATKLRLPPQSTYDKSKRKKEARSRPWAE